MNGELRIALGDRGGMVISMPAFFPCTKQKMKALLALIKEDWQNQDSIYDRLATYFYRQMLMCNDKINFAKILPDEKLLKEQLKQLNKWSGLMSMLPAEYQRQIEETD